MEYPDGCSTAMRYIARKVGLYALEVISLWGRYFQTDGLAYDKPPSIEQPLPLAPRPGVIGCTLTSSSPPQFSTFQPFLWLWPLPLSWLSEPHALHNKPPLPLANKGGTIAPPHAIAAFHGTALQAFQCHFEKCWRGQRKT